MNDKIKEILSKYKTIAMVGVSKDPTKASTIVMKYMQNYGYKVIPVNPRAKGEKILGESVFEKLDSNQGFKSQKPIMVKGKLKEIENWIYSAI